MVPKPLLRVRWRGDERMMLEYVLRTLPAGVAPLVALPPDASWERRTDKATGRLSKIVVLKKHTLGQAHTVGLLLFQEEIPVDDDTSVLVLDCDVLLPPETLLEMLRQVRETDVVVAVAPSDKAAMSYVDVVPAFHLVREKQRISQWGVVGARAFRRAGDLRDALARQEDLSYLTHTINEMPACMTRLALPVPDWVDWGTPAALAASGAVIMEDTPDQDSRAGGALPRPSEGAT